MKRFLICLLVLMMILPAALADTMAVVNCKEWVSLREKPNTSAKRLCEVPLYAHVEDCEDAENGFTRCTYEGQTGYILTKYLEPVEADEPADDNTWTFTAGSYTLTAQRDFAEDGEHLTLSCASASGEELWRKVTMVNEVGQMNETEAFLGGTAEAPRAMLYTTVEGLMSLDVGTGDAVWTLTPDQVRLGAGQAHFVDEQGRMYISGYDGPDPVCIDMDGNVLWKASAGSDDIFWPYQITVTDEGVVTEYENMGEGSGRVVYDLNDGHVLRTEIDQ